MVAELLLAEVGDAEHVGLFAVLDPGQPLALRVDEDRVAAGAGHHDAVLHRELVGGQALEVPLANLRLVDEEIGHLQVLGDRDAAVDAVAREVALEEELAELLVERAEVRDEGGGERAVAGEALDGVVKLLRLRGPALFLASEGVDQSVGAVHLLLRRRRVILEALLLSHSLVEFRLHLVELSLHLRHLGLGGILLLHRSLELSLRGAQTDNLRLDHLSDIMIGVHGLAPVTEASDVAGSLFGGVEVVVGGGEVRLEQLARLIRDLLLGEGHERREEVDVGHHFDRLGVRAVDHHSALDVLPRNLIDRELAEDEHSVKDALDNVGRVLERLEGTNVLRRDGRERRDGVVERGLGRREVLLGILLDRANLVRLFGHRLNDDEHLRLLLLGDGGRCGNLLEQIRRHALRLGEIGVLDGELPLHLVDVVLRLEELGETAVDFVRELLHLGQLAAVQILVAGDEGEV
mmetsp:Transcript_23991/g.78014  ORF Transcript_23991/g.78014 Transcript_23991/m.78014 type:complete len:463 (+) Transcript_23991:3039-4427(+)